MLIETHLLSTVHRLLQELCIPIERFFITWPTRVYPSIGVVNIRDRHKPEKYLHCSLGVSVIPDSNSCYTGEARKRMEDKGSKQVCCR